MSDLLPSPDFDGDDTLTRRRRAAAALRQASPFRIVVIDDDPAILRLVAAILASPDTEVVCCATGKEGIEALEHSEWDLCLLDRRLPDLDGMEICRRVKADPRFDARRLVVLSAFGSIEARVEALDLGADDYVIKPFHPTELLARVNASRRAVEMQKQLVAMAEQLEELSTRDGLTGVFNRRHFAAALERAYAQSVRYSRPLSVALIDVDHFKDINDSRGHQTGDAVLAEVARRFLRSVRASDYVARVGGEEFVVLLPETQLHDAFTFGEKLRQAIAGNPVHVGAGSDVPVTVSVGTASLSHTRFASADDMLAAADEALYRAKRNGRNRVECERRRERRSVPLAS